MPIILQWSPKKKGAKRSKRSRISGPYIPYGLFQTKRETCAKFGSDRFRNVNLYEFHTNKQTNIFIYKILAYIQHNGEVSLKKKLEVAVISVQKKAKLCAYSRTNVSFI